MVSEKLLKSKISLTKIITFPDKKIGRGQKKEPLPLKKFGIRNNIPIEEVDNIIHFHDVIEKEKADIVVVASFGLIIPKKTLSLGSKFINIHPSLLPKYRGPTPIQTSIVNGDQKSGVTLLFMDEKIDHGPIIDQRKVIFHQKIKYEEAEKLLAQEGGDLFTEKLPILKEKTNATPQREEEATYTNLLTKRSGLINWNESAKIIERKVRAYNPWPGTHTKVNCKNLKILEADVQLQTENCPSGVPGKLYLGTNNTLAVQTGKNFLLIKKLQLEGKNPTTSKEFLQGNISIIGSTLS